MIDMTTTAATTTSSTGRPRGSLSVLVGLVVIWALWLLAYLFSPDHNADGRCEGLGWGCTLTPRQGVQFVGILAVAPLTVFVLAVSSVVRLVRISRGSPRTAWDVAVWCLLVAAALWWLFATVMGAI